MLGKGGEGQGCSLSARCGEGAGKGAEQGQMQFGALGGDDKQGDERGLLTHPINAAFTGGEADERRVKAFETRMGYRQTVAEVGALLLFAFQSGGGDAVGLRFIQRGGEGADGILSAHPFGERGAKDVLL